MKKRKILFSFDITGNRRGKKRNGDEGRILTVTHLACEEESYTRSAGSGLYKSHGLAICS